MAENNNYDGRLSLIKTLTLNDRANKTSCHHFNQTLPYICRAAAVIIIGYSFLNSFPDTTMSEELNAL